MRVKLSGSIRRVSSTSGFRPQFRAALSSARRAAFGARRRAGRSYVRIALQNIVDRYMWRGREEGISARKKCPGVPASNDGSLYRDTEPVSTELPVGEIGSRVNHDQNPIAAVLPYFLHSAHSSDCFSAPSPESQHNRAAVIFGSRGLMDNFITKSNTRKDLYGS